MDEDKDDEEAPRPLDGETQRDQFQLQSDIEIGDYVYFNCDIVQDMLEALYEDCKDKDESKPDFLN